LSELLPPARAVIFQRSRHGGVGSLARPATSGPRRLGSHTEVAGLRRRSPGFAGRSPEVAGLRREVAGGRRASPGGRRRSPGFAGRSYIRFRQIGEVAEQASSIDQRLVARLHRANEAISDEIIQVRTTALSHLARLWNRQDRRKRCYEILNGSGHLRPSLVKDGHIHITTKDERRPVFKTQPDQVERGLCPMSPWSKPLGRTRAMTAATTGRRIEFIDV
jgi:hypothetical protein